MIIGLTISWWFSIFGVTLFVITTVKWVRDTRRDIDELPEEHHHPH
jgi:dolichyl-phosphate-mannose--protein O-mannosyl transferase